MTRYLLNRAVGTIPVILLIGLAVFLLLHAAPGDPATILIGDEATTVDIEAARERWGLDQPVIVQFLQFVVSALQFDFGDSFKYGYAVNTLIAERLPATLELAVLSTLLAIVIALPLGVWAARRPNSWLDILGSTMGFVGISMPPFWMAIMLILLVSGQFNLLPSNGRGDYEIYGEMTTGFATVDAVVSGDWRAFADALRHMVLPATVLALNMVGILLRVTRSAMLEVLGEDYVMTARAKGLGERVVIWRHALRNALVTVVTVVGLEFGALLSGSLIVEVVFSWPGIGSLLLQGIGARDYPLITGTVLVYTTLFIIVNLLVDFLYALTDPRIRMGD